MAKHRIHYTLDAGVVRLFQLMCPHGKRSLVLERLMAQWCVENYDRAKENRARAVDKLAGRVELVRAVQREHEKQDGDKLHKAIADAIGEPEGGGTSVA